MYEAYGRAVVEERAKPRHDRVLAAYLRWEYGPGTEPASLRAELANGGRPPRRPPGNGGALHALANALRALFPVNGNGRRPVKAQTVR